MRYLFRPRGTQVHQSPQRIEIITSFSKHPVEIAVNGLLSNAILYFIVGLDPAGASGADPVGPS